MVYRLVKRVSAVLSLLMLLIIVWFIYLLNYPQHPSTSKYYRIHHINSPSSVINHSSGNDTKHIVSHLDPINSQEVKSKDFNNSVSDKHVKSESIISDFDNINTQKGRDLLSRIRTNCTDRICSEFLTDRDRPHFKYCIHKTWKIPVSKHKEPLNSVCVFIDGSNRYPMALASYPGSGNTWLRGLIQTVTGLCIGGIYCDITLRQNGYPGESIRSGVTFMVKTHQIDPRWEGIQYAPDSPFTYFKTIEHVPVYAGGVFIMRNPFRAMVAEFKRQEWEDEADNHIKTLGQEHFGECAVTISLISGRPLHSLLRG